MTGVWGQSTAAPSVIKGMKTNETAFTGLKWSLKEWVWNMMATYHSQIHLWNSDKGYCTKPCGWQRLNLTWKWNEYALLTISWDTKKYIWVCTLYLRFYGGSINIGPNNQEASAEPQGQTWITESSPKGALRSTSSGKTTLVISKRDTRGCFISEVWSRLASQGRGSQVGCHPWGRRVGHDWSDLAAAAVRSERQSYTWVNQTPH